MSRPRPWLSSICPLADMSEGYAAISRSALPAALVLQAWRSRQGTTGPAPSRHVAADAMPGLRQCAGSFARFSGGWPAAKVSRAAHHVAFGRPGEGSLLRRPHAPGERRRFEARCGGTLRLGCDNCATNSEQFRSIPRRTGSSVLIIGPEGRR
jgi:hypothetical protein